MKKTDIAMIILIATISMGIAYAVAQQLPFLKLDENGVKVDTIDEISSTVVEPDPATFSKGAINPTVQVVIGQAE